MRIIRILLIAGSILSFTLFGILQFMEIAGRDTSAPQITSEVDIVEVSCDYSEEDLLAGLSAWDEQDGDLTSQIIPGAMSRFVEKGICSQTCVVFDQSGQSASLTRKVKFTDYHSPRFSLSAPLVFAEGQGNYTEIQSRLRASDALDGDRTEWMIMTESTVNYQKIGDYTISFSVENSFGDISEVDLPVHIVESGQQAITISLTTGLVYVSENQKIQPQDYISEVTAPDGTTLLPSQVTAVSNINYSVPGCYEVHYQVSDALGNEGQTWLTVIVEDEGGAQ